MEWIGLEWMGVDWMGVEWKGMERSGFSGMKQAQPLSPLPPILF